MKSSSGNTLSSIRSQVILSDYGKKDGKQNSQALISEYERKDAKITRAFTATQQWFSLQELAAFFGASVRTMQRWFAPYLRPVPGGNKVCRDDVIRFM